MLRKNYKRSGSQEGMRFASKRGQVAVFVILALVIVAVVLVIAFYPKIKLPGGAGATPFIAILRQLAKDHLIKGNTLIFSNKKHEDIILEREFKLILGENCIFTLTREKRDGYEHGRIDEEFLKRYVKDFKQEFYICGPDKFVSDIKKILERLKAPSEVIVFER